jgi:hypothetical protein
MHRTKLAPIEALQRRIAPQFNLHGLPAAIYYLALETMLPIRQNPLIRQIHRINSKCLISDHPQDKVIALSSRY